MIYETLFLSVDPYLRGRMNEGKSYIEPFALGEPVSSGYVGRVLESNLAQYQPGDLLTGMGPWARYGTSDGHGVAPVAGELPPSSLLGVLGMPGLTAYVGLLDIGQAKAGETVVVSAAAGAVGSVVIQLAKHRGCRVVGIAGGEKKCKYVTEELGADFCIDYRNEDVEKSLKRHCPRGIDVYFENVGGEIFAAVLANLADHARIPLCGMISEYNAKNIPAGPNLRPLLARKAMIQGFIVMEHWDRHAAFVTEIGPLVASGKFKYREDVVQGLEKAPEALLRVLRGENFGKQLVKVASS